MKVQIKPLLEGAKSAEGTVVIIDVINASSTMVKCLEMGAKEIVPVKFFYSLSIPPQDKEIIATLEMGSGGDPSVFEKVLPALIADEKSLLASQQPQESDLGGNEKVGYSSIDLAQDKEKAKTVKITWVFNKENLSSDLKNKYKEVNSFPVGITRVLYSIPSLVIAVLGG